MNYLDNKTHFQHVVANLRRLIPWVLGAALIFMGLKMAISTWANMRYTTTNGGHNGDR